MGWGRHRRQINPFSIINQLINNPLRHGRPFLRVTGSIYAIQFQYLLLPKGA
jgi:hypothetical protein